MTQDDRIYPTRNPFQDAAESGNANIVQQLEDPSTPELLRKEGAGLLPSSQAPHGKMAPPVAATKHAPK